MERPPFPVRLPPRDGSLGRARRCLDELTGGVSAAFAPAVPTSLSLPHRRRVAPVRNPKRPYVRLRLPLRRAGAVPEGPRTDRRTDRSLADHDAAGRYGHFPVDHDGSRSHRTEADADRRGSVDGAGRRRFCDDRKPHPAGSCRHDRRAQPRRQGSRTIPLDRTGGAFADGAR